MFLVTMYTFGNCIHQPLVITETREKAQEWIDKQMEGYVYNGTGVHKIQEIPLYK